MDDAQMREAALRLLAVEYDSESRPIRATELRSHGACDDDDKRALRAIEAALALNAGVGGWQTTESAPKDGTEVDLWGCSNRGEKPARVPDCQWRKGAWFSRGDNGWEPLAGIAWTPTHWRPLPTPPAAIPALGEKSDG